MTGKNTHTLPTTEASAKAMAGKIGNFLEERGIAVPRTTALDLVASLCGSPNWRTMRALYATEAAGRPIQISLEDFIKKFKPIRNVMDEDEDSLNSYAFGTQGADMDAVRTAYEKAPYTVWTVVDVDGTQWLTSGLHYVNREYYVITRKPRDAAKEYEIPVFHSPDDTEFVLRIRDLKTSEIHHEATVFASDADEVREMEQCDIESTCEDIASSGGTPMVSIEEQK